MKIKFKIILFVINLLSCWSIYAMQSSSLAENFSTREVVKQFIIDMENKHKFDRQELETLFSQYNTNSEVLYKISNPTEKLSWGQYKKLLLSPERIAGGKKFLQEYKLILQQAELQYGVPKELISAILGVESFYGQRIGNTPVLQALATLAFDYPPRQNFFRQELEHFLLLTKEENLDPVNLKGSYAGAMAPAQFISSSYRAYAVDFANIGKKDLNYMPNSIGSIANYLHKHGWVKKEPVAVAAKIVVSNNYAKHIQRSSIDPKPVYSLQHFKKIGVETLKLSVKDLNKRAVLLELISSGSSGNVTNKKEYWFGFNNFYVITRYNKSIYYAMAVHQLATNLGLKQ